MTTENQGNFWSNTSLVDVITAAGGVYNQSKAISKFSDPQFVAATAGVSQQPDQGVTGAGIVPGVDNKMLIIGGIVAAVVLAVVVSK